MARGKRSVPEEIDAINKFRYEASDEIGIPLDTSGQDERYLRGNSSSKSYVLKKLIEYQENGAKNSGK